MKIKEAEKLKQGDEVVFNETNEHGTQNKICKVLNVYLFEKMVVFDLIDENNDLIKEVSHLEVF